MRKAPPWAFGLLLPRRLGDPSAFSAWGGGKGWSSEGGPLSDPGDPEAPLAARWAMAAPNDLWDARGGLVACSPRLLSGEAGSAPAASALDVPGAPQA